MEYAGDGGDDNLFFGSGGEFGGCAEEWEAIVLRETGLGESSSSGSSSPMSLVRRSLLGV